MEGTTDNFQVLMKYISTFNGEKTDDLLELSSKIGITLSLFNNFTINIVQGSQWYHCARVTSASGLDNDQATACEAWDYENHSLYCILCSATTGPKFSAVGVFGR